jgi:outer membrane receptor protein involved in Fe transport
VGKPCLLALFVLTQVAASAQTVRGTVSGTVTDPTGKRLAGAAVQVTASETSRARKTVSDAEGNFAVTSLAPGPYRVEADLEGFGRHSREFTLLLNQEVWVEMPLVPARRTEVVEVREAAGTLRTESSALGGIVENRQVTGLPLDGRNFYELALLLSGVAPPAQGSAGSVRGDFAIHVDGGREDANQFLLDGIFNGDPKLNGVAVTPPVDAIREFEVAAGAFDASLGRNAGGQVAVALKSGTNDFHGALWEFLRNRVLDARNFFAPAEEAAPQDQRNQFGAALGGPVARQRTFFFGDYEGRRVREGVTRVTNVPTQLERSGDFSKSTLFAIDPFSQQPFPGNSIPKAYINPVGLAIAALYPLPNRAAAGQNYVSSPDGRDREDHLDARVDHSLGASDEMAVRYSLADRAFYQPFSGPDFTAVPGFGTNVPRRAQNAAASETHIFSPRLLNEVRLGFNRVSAGTFQENMGRDLNAQVGLPRTSSNPRDTGLSLVRITGFSPVGDEYHNPQHSASTLYQATDTLTMSRGRHVFQAGADLRWLQQNAYRDELGRGYLSFLGMTGNALAEMLLGLPSVTGVARIDNQQHLRTHNYYFFAQDSWRVRPDVTVSAGVRYEFNAPPVDAGDRANLYDAATQSLVRAGTQGMPRGGYLPDRNNFAPRVSAAWRPAKGGTVLRAGYGIYYDQPALAIGEGLYFNQPYYDLKLYFPLDGLPLTLADPFPRNFPIALPSSALAFQRDLRTGYVQHWDFGVQREIAGARILEVAYAGSKGTKLPGARDWNQPLPSPRQPNSRPVQQFDDINALESRGNSGYHSLQARFRQNLRKGVTALASYTWSKSIDDGSGFFTTAGDPNYPQDSRHIALERGLSDFDMRHRLSASYSWDLPLGRGRWLGGWQTYGVWTFESGRPFTVALLSDLDNSNTGRSNLGFGANDRPNALRSAALSHPSAGRWFDTAAFAMPAFGAFGNAGRNILTGPGYGNANVSVVKNTRVTEAASAQLRIEAFNLLNRTNLGLPDNFLGSPTFGKIQTAGNPRRLQFGIKLIF